jgi:hypothetical protein
MSDSQKKLLKNIVIDDENIAVSVMAGMLEVAQSRGAFNMEESSKTWECISFLRNLQQKANSDTDKNQQSNVQLEINEKN